MNENQSENNYRYPENAYRDQKGAPYSYEPIPRSPAPLYKKQPEPTRRKTRGWVGLMATALCFSLLGSALGAGGVMYYISREESAQEEPLQQEVLPAEEQPTEDAEDPVTIMVEGVRENAAIELVQVDTSKVMTAAEVYAAARHRINALGGVTRVQVRMR